MVWSLRRILRQSGRQSVPVILMYHRVASPLIDPWGLAVTPDHFRDQLTTLAQRRTILAHFPEQAASLDGSA